MTTKQRCAPLARPGASFLRADDGATAVEFALVAMPLLIVLLGLLQMVVIFFAGQVLQSLATSAARNILVGQAQSSGLTQGQFQTFVCGLAPPLFQCSKIMVDVESAASFGALNTAPLTLTYNALGQPTNLSYSPGGKGSAVIVRVMYDWPVLGGPFAVGLANASNGQHLMVGTSVFKTEPY